ncbi:MAG: HIT domain-containing protein [Caldilineaceae bacterium]|nr:HIT domain-containing protein [Caldilineaceae bacterium]
MEERRALMDDCIFCQIAQGTADSWKVYETDSAYAFLDIHPVNEYHTLVIPKNHYVNIFDVPEHELVQVISALKHVVDLYHDRLGIGNVQIVNSSGAQAQQDVFHLHFHIIPRYKGDQQDIHWSTYPEMRARFDQLLARLL